MSGLKEIAKAAGVSMTTVSNVINGNLKRVSRDKAEEIQALIREHGYVPNQAARNLAQGGTRMVAIIGQASDDEFTFLNPFISAYFTALVMHLYRRDYTPLICVTKDYRTIERDIRGWNVAGVLITGSFIRNLQKIESLSSIPVVLNDCYFDLPGASHLDLDDEAGGRVAGEYLVGMGHRRVGFIANAYPDSDVDLQRLKGLRESLSAHGIQVPDAWIVPSWNLEAQRDCFAAIFGAAERPTAFFCSADFSAAGLIKMAGEFGLRTPEDLSVVGFDNTPLGQLTSPTLTTVAQDANEKAKRTVDMLLRHIEDRSLPPEHEVFGVRLVERESVRRIG